MEFVEVDAGDYERIIEFWELCGIKPDYDYRDTIESFVWQIEQPNTYYIYLEDNGEIIGIIFGTHDSRRAWVNRLAVHPEWRNTGIASMLIAEVENWIYRDTPIRQMNAFIKDLNEASINLFMKLGYEEREGRKHFMKIME